MLDYSREAILLVEKRCRSDLDSDRMLQLSLVRLVEIVGEAASRVSVDTRRRYPQVPWPQIAGMRNRLIHGYDFVDYDILWQTVREDLPALVAALERLMPPLPFDPRSGT